MKIKMAKEISVFNSEEFERLVSEKDISRYGIKKS